MVISCPGSAELGNPKRWKGGKSRRSEYCGVRKSRVNHRSYRLHSDSPRILEWSLRIGRLRIFGESEEENFPSSWTVKTPRRWDPAGMFSTLNSSRRAEVGAASSSKLGHFQSSNEFLWESRPGSGERWHPGAERALAMSSMHPQITHRG
jgi:hypothetical protein